MKHTMFKKAAAALTVGCALGVPFGAAQAAPYLGDFNTGAPGFDGVLSSITGFDINSNGSAAFYCATPAGCGPAGFRPFGSQLNPAGAADIKPGDLVTTRYQGIVIAVNPGASTPNLITPNDPVGTYQITVAAIFNEFVVATFPGSALLQPIAGGRVSMFYDTAALSGTFITNTLGILAGVGYTDGMLIIDGGVGGSNPANLFSLTGGGNAAGSASVSGDLDFAEPYDGVTPTDVGFNPIPGDYTSTTTLQFGPATPTDYRTVNFFDAANGWGAFKAAANPLFTLRADGNVDLSALQVPEPASLALLGIGLLGLARMRPGVKRS